MQNVDSNENAPIYLIGKSIAIYDLRFTIYNLQMPFELKLAVKYFRAKRKSLARFTSIAAIVGIAAGVASLIIAQSLANGFSDEMRDKILANTAHISIFMNDGAEVFDWKNIKNQLEKSENVTDVSPTKYQNSIIIGKTATSYAILRTVQKAEVQSSKSKVQSPKQFQNKDQIKISIGAELAKKSGLKKGDEAEIVLFENEETPEKTTVHVAETFQTGLYEYDSTWINIPPEDYIKLTKTLSFAPTILSVSVSDIYKANETAAEIRAKLGANYKVLDWQKANQPLFAALLLERKVSLWIISLIIFIAALNITTTLALLVNERKLDIAVLRTCGARARSLVFIFLFEGLFLGFIGIFLGVILGLLVCFAGNYFKIVRLSAEVYSLNYIPFHPNFMNILLIIFIAFLLCLAATVYPAFRASRIKPLENLRHQ